MMSSKQNDRLTRVGENTPAGDLLRRYWQPVALVEELQGPRPLKAVKLLGQDFILFRDEQGKYGMLERHCPHRGADLAYGRLEDGGVRCAFHGWLFDAEGRCLETPAEPLESRFCDKIRVNAFRIEERSGILFCYLGSGDPPRFPAFDCFLAPPEYTFAFKGFLECNWLQALEVGIDPAHASYLHRFFQDAELSGSYGKQFRGSSANSAMPITQVLREFDRPEIRVNSTAYGLQLFALRSLDVERTHVRVTNVLFPQAFVIPMSPTMTISQWHVPVDDYHSYWYAIFTSFGEEVDKERMRSQRLEQYELPDYKPRRNKRNNYGFSPEEQATETYTGMGHDINVHDQWAVESQGAIQDRTKEHLGMSDIGIIAYRRLLGSAIEQHERGEDPLMTRGTTEANHASSLTGPVAIDAVLPAATWEEDYKQSDEDRRRQAPWCSISGRPGSAEVLK
jgi:phthalate 4,5-dioxygenase